jgi:phosphate starvation-inducible PhoH-like protein
MESPPPLKSAKLAKPPQSTAFEFHAAQNDNLRLANLCGPLDENLRQIEQALDVTLTRRNYKICATGDSAATAIAALEKFYRRARTPLSVDDIQLGLVEMQPVSHSVAPPSDEADLPELYTRTREVRGRTPAQRAYINSILTHDLAFGIGPAGTGKTYLAVACAVDALEREQVKRIVLTRPAVEAGERLGFLPGDLAQKIDPYLRPLYDALYELLGFDKTTKLFERQIIEVAPLAYMRGRTLNHAFIILDEAQNTTPEQMKMFLTRIGFGSKAVVTGDTSQVDLPRGHKSGLLDAQHVLSDLRGIAITRLSSADIVRHPLVARIVEAYEAQQGQHAQRDTTPPSA